MLYFNDFPKIQYKFGNETDPVVFQDISIYSDVVDQIRGASAEIHNRSNEV